jgi:hypothetical protein
MSAAISQIVSAVEKVDQSIYAILNKLSVTQLEKLADDAGLFYINTSALKNTVRLGYDVGDILPEAVFDVYEG